MSQLKNNISKFFVKLILPSILIIVCVLALIRMGDVGERMNFVKEKSEKMSAKLETRKIQVLELRRKMIILGMPDFREAVRKSSLTESPDGEDRIRVK